MKTAFVVPAVVVLMAGLLFGRNAGSYITTAWKNVRQVVKDQVPVDFELERAQAMIDRLGPQVREQLQMVAAEEVALDGFREQAAAMDQRLVTQKQQIDRLRADAESGNDQFVYSGRSYSIDQVRADLARRFARYQADQRTLAQLQKQVAAREQNVRSGREHVEAMRTAQRNLQADVDSLAARKNMLDVAEAAGQPAFDDSHLARTEEALDDIRSRIAGAERFLELERESAGEIPVADESGDILSQLAGYFGDDELAGEAELVVSDEAADEPAVSADDNVALPSDAPSRDGLQRRFRHWLQVWLDDFMGSARGSDTSPAPVVPATPADPDLAIAP